MKSAPCGAGFLENTRLRDTCSRHGDIPPLDQTDPIDAALYTANQFDLDYTAAETIRFSAIKSSLAYHLEHNAFYRRFCETSGFGLADLQAPEDLQKLPLVPEHIFKSSSGPDDFIPWLASITTDEFDWPDPGTLQGSYDDQIAVLRQQHRILVRSTSGSSGIPSFLPRDSVTRRRSAHWKIITFLAMHPDILSSDDLISVTLWPLDFSWADLFTQSERVYALLDKKLGLETVMRAMTRPSESRGILDRLLRKKDKDGGSDLLGSLFDRLTAILENRSPGILWSPPFLIYALALYLKEKRIQLELGANWKIELGGGWKLLNEQPLSEPELRTLATEVFAIPTGNIHDIYGSTECLGLCGLSCEGGYKHIPHTVLHPMVLNDNMEPEEYGRWGRFAFLNPLIRSYPGFIITGDRVRIWQSCPVCSRTGPVLDPEITRMSDAEDRGCANIVREIVTERMTT